MQQTQQQGPAAAPIREQRSPRVQQATEWGQEAACPTTILDGEGETAREASVTGAEQRQSNRMDVAICEQGRLLGCMGLR